jgi:O-antigen/teichoic acid export membrane protein
MNIDPERMAAANWVYQCSVFSFLLTIISVPYNACIVAHEHIKAYAYVSIYEAIVKLLIVFSLAWFTFDKLKLYAILTLLLSGSIRIIYGIYCKRHFNECKFHFTTDKKLFREMMRFAGWSFIGNIGFAFKNQGINILINLFFGVTVNAARGIAYTVTSHVSGFVSNFQMAMNPLITKQYAAGNINSMIRLVFRGSKYSFFLLSFIAIPVFIKTPYILQLWLGIVPGYSTMFLRLALVMALIDSMAGPLVTAMQATGRIRNFQIIIAGIMLINLPVSYLILRLGGNPYSVMYVAIFTSLLGLVVRAILLNSLIRIQLKTYLKSVIIKCFSVISLSVLIPFYVSFHIKDNFYGLLLICIISVLSVAFTIFFVGLNRKEQIYVAKRIGIFIDKLKKLLRI